MKEECEVCWCCLCVCVCVHACVCVCIGVCVCVCVCVCSEEEKQNSEYDSSLCSGGNSEYSYTHSSALYSFAPLLLMRRLFAVVLPFFYHVWFTCLALALAVLPIVGASGVCFAALSKCSSSLRRSQLWPRLPHIPISLDPKLQPKVRKADMDLN